MGSLNKFLGAPKVIEVEGNEIKIIPLKVKDMNKFAKQNATPEEQTQMSREILKLSIEDTTDEEIDALPLEVFTKIMDEINKLNGFTDDKLDAVKRSIEQRKARN